jgi:hypothetical protein
MSLSSLLSWIFSNNQARSARPRRPATLAKPVRLVLEQLEDRIVPALTYGVIRGVLTLGIQEPQGSGNTVIISESNADVVSVNLDVVSANLNVTTTSYSFSATSLNFTSVALSTPAGVSNGVYVSNTVSNLGLTINDYGQDGVVMGASTAQYGYGHVQGIAGPVTMTNYSNNTELTFDDSADATGALVSVNSTSVQFSFSGQSSPTTFSFPANVNILGVFGGQGANTFTVNNTPAAATYLSTGAGNDSVNVLGTTGPFYDGNGAGMDYTTIGNAGNVQGINGPVHVFGSGATSLIVNDSADTTGRTVTMNDGSLTGLTPASAPIVWTPTATSTGGVTALKVSGGSGTNTFNVDNTSSFWGDTYLVTSSGYNTVNVLGTTGALAINNDEGTAAVTVVTVGNDGTTQTIDGYVNVYGSGTTTLVVNDSADTTGRTVTMNNGWLTGLTPDSAPIEWTPSSTSTGGVIYLDVVGGSGGDTFTVANTSNLSDGTYLEIGTGNVTVNVLATTGALYVENAGGMDDTTIGNATVGVQDINGPVDVWGWGSGATLLNVNDRRLCQRLWLRHDHPRRKRQRRHHRSHGEAERRLADRPGPGDHRVDAQFHVRGRRELP